MLVLLLCTIYLLFYCLTLTDPCITVTSAVLCCVFIFHTLFIYLNSKVRGSIAAVYCTWTFFNCETWQIEYESEIGVLNIYFTDKAWFVLHMFFLLLCWSAKAFHMWHDYRHSKSMKRWSQCSHIRCRCFSPHQKSFTSYKSVCIPEFLKNIKSSSHMIPQQ